VVLFFVRRFSEADNFSSNQEIQSVLCGIVNPLVQGQHRTLFRTLGVPSTPTQRISFKILASIPRSSKCSHFHVFRLKIFRYSANSEDTRYEVLLADVIPYSLVGMFYQRFGVTCFSHLLSPDLITNLLPSSSGRK
jgi:hypothetical protein